MSHPNIPPELPQEEAVERITKKDQQLLLYMFLKSGTEPDMTGIESLKTSATGGGFYTYLAHAGFIEGGRTEHKVYWKVTEKGVNYIQSLGEI